MYVTTEEQSKRLFNQMSNNLQIETADFCYLELDGKYYLYNNPYREMANNVFNDKFIPAWSIGALWDILNRSELKFSPNTQFFNSEKLISGLVNTILYAIRAKTLIRR